MRKGDYFILGVLLCGTAAHTLTGNYGYDVLVGGIGCIIGAAFMHFDDGKRGR